MESKNNEITTIKIEKQTKLRLNRLKEYERETYNQTIKKMLFILNTCRENPEKARKILRNIDLIKEKKLRINRDSDIESG